MNTSPTTANKVEVRKYNEVYNRIIADDSVAQELKDFFTFKAPNYRFHPLYKKRKWNGDITLFSPHKRLLYAGLTPYVKAFCAENNYACHVGDDLDLTTEFSLKVATEFIADLALPSVYQLRPYQVKSFAYCVRNRRALFVSPTASGKSMIIYWLVRYYYGNGNSHADTADKILIIVDSVNLLNQLASDFTKYGFQTAENVHLISSGAAKNSSKPIIITTWQSAATQPEEWFNQFRMVIGDEAHRYKAMSLKKIMESLTDCKYRFGLTGSLDDSQSNRLTLEGLFGPHKRITTTKKLIDEGYLAQVEIKALLLKYSDPVRQAHAKDAYEDELSFLYNNVQRNRFIENLALSLRGNTIILFQRLAEHGVPLHASLVDKVKCPLYYVAGNVHGDERDKIRQIVDTHEHSITVASVGTFSTGVDIPNLNNIIIASPTKSMIRVLQTVGRGLRRSSTKYNCTVFDIADNLQWKAQQNHTLRHFAERMKIYIKEEFKYKLYQIEIKDNEEPTPEAWESKNG